MQKFIWSLMLAASVATVACGDWKSSMNPVSPSAVVVDAQSQDAGADGAVSGPTGGPKNGNGNNGGGNGNSGGGNGGGGGNGKPESPGNGGGNGSGNGNQPTVPGNSQTPTNTSPNQKKVELQGPVTSKGAGSITVRGQLVTVPESCVIRHGSTTYTLADIQVGDLVHVRASRITSGTGALATTTLEATEIMFQNPGFDDGEGSDSLVSVSAFDAVADESGTNPGAFRLTRAGSAAALASALTVTVAITGTATNGTDYQTMLLTVTFPATQTTVDVPVTPIADSTTEVPETVIMTLTTLPAPYELGSPSTATVTISDAPSTP